MRTAALLLSEPPPGGARYRLTAPNLPTTPGIARDWVVLVLRTANLPRLVEPARLCTSEVVTNAHRYGRTPSITVEVALADRRTTVLVHDDRPGELPRPATSDRYTGEEHGRGLLLVDSLAEDWGVRVLDGRTKAVCFTLVDHEGS
ncbi:MULTISPECIES: ATP-binding protein [Streptomyces]|uniref:ATP-binding protein n=1 Tax=Streptomyces sudanensis TaxID=436397 RepID=A0ABY4T961_9ACTN|nr:MULTISPECIES: ATP-binding protein [Streptomyces]URN15507.1 ATP-binding protein [Streptomyces sudanensis]